MINLLRPSDHEAAPHDPSAERRKCNCTLAEIQVGYPRPQSQKRREDALLDAEDKHTEVRKNERGWAYEDKRQQYIESHTILFTKNTDKNINDLVSTLLVQQNKFSRSITKYARKNLK